MTNNLEMQPPKLTRSVRRFLPSLPGLIVLAALLIVLAFVMRPRVDMIDARNVRDGAWPTGTFHTQSLVVDNLATFAPSATSVAGTGIQIGSVPPTFNQAILTITGVNASQQDQISINASDTGHASPGIGIDNEELAVVIRNSSSFDTNSTGHAKSAGLDIAMEGTISAGVGNLENRGLNVISTCGGHPNCAAWTFYGDSTDGTLFNRGPFDFSPSSEGKLGFHVQPFALVPTTPTLTVPQFDIGVAVATDGYNMHIRNTTIGVAAMGIALEGDTTVNPSVAPQFVIGRGAGGALTNFSLLCSDNGTASCLAAAAANDLVLANYGTGSSMWLAAKGDVHLGTTTVESTKLTTKGHWVQTTSTGTPGLSAACGTGGGQAIVGNDNRFEVITGAASTSCVITFVNTWTSKPICNITTEGGIALPTYTVSPTAVTITVNLNAGVYNADCQGQPGST